MVLGKHVILELYGCPQTKLNDIQYLEDTLKEAALSMNATIVTTNFHHFSPYGVSGVVVIQESHLTIHTWPEYGYAALDVFTCGEINLEAGIQYLIQYLGADSHDRKLIDRGISILQNEDRKHGFHDTQQGITSPTSY